MTNPIPPKVWSFFRAAERNDYASAATIFDKLVESEYAPRTNRPVAAIIWDEVTMIAVGRGEKRAALEGLALAVPMLDTKEVMFLFRTSDPGLIRRFGSEVVAALTTNSVFLAGTLPGRLTVSLATDPSKEGSSLRTIALARLADRDYLRYLRQACGTNLAIPTVLDQQADFDSFVFETMALLRIEMGGSPPSSIPPPWRARMAVADISARLAQRLVESNPGREFFVDDAFSVQWALRNLEPTGPLLRLREKPLGSFDQELVERDRRYWTALFAELMGPWLQQGTSVEEICAFGELTLVRKDLSGFKGSRSFLADGEIRQAFARLRASTARVYLWRAEHAGSPQERLRMLVEADFAWRQALAMAPWIPEASGAYASTLWKWDRPEAARAVVVLWATLNPEDPQARLWVGWFRGQPHMNLK